MEKALKGVGVKWLKKVRSYNVATMVKTLRAAMTTRAGGLKVIIADGECQLARQRRLNAEKTRKLAAGQRIADERFGVDDDVCTGDHSCIRLSGCPSLTIKDNRDPLRHDPVAQVNQDCEGCGLCGEVAHVARLCPSFYRVEVIHNPTRLDRLVHGLRQRIINALQGGFARGDAR